MNKNEREHLDAVHREAWYFRASYWLTVGNPVNKEKLLKELLWVDWQLPKESIRGWSYLALIAELKGNAIRAINCRIQELKLLSKAVGMIDPAKSGDRELINVIETELRDNLFQAKRVFERNKKHTHIHRLRELKRTFVEHAKKLSKEIVRTTGHDSSGRTPCRREG